MNKVIRRIKNYFNSFIDSVDQLLSRLFRFKLSIGCFKLEIGWFSGEDVCVLNFKFFEIIPMCLTIIASIKIFKFSVTLYFDLED